MKRTLLICFLSLLNPVFSQKLRPLPGIPDQQLALHYHSNLFRDFGWSWPDLGSRPLARDRDSVFRFSWAGQPAEMRRLPDSMELLLGGMKLRSARFYTEHDMYYRRDAVGLKHISHEYTAASYRTIPTFERKINYQHIYYFVHDRQTGNYTMVTEVQPSMSIRESYINAPYYYREHYDDYLLFLPAYRFFSFELPDSSRMIVYELNAGPNDRRYFVQNVAYLQASGAGGMHFVLMDSNADGFYDETDQLMITADHRQQKKHKGFMFHHWMKFSQAERELQLSLRIRERQLLVKNPNHALSENNEKGSFSLPGFPDRSTVYINGYERKLKPGHTYQAVYGNYHIRVMDGRKLMLSDTFSLGIGQPLVKLDGQRPFPQATVKVTHFIFPIYSARITNTDTDWTHFFLRSDNMKVPAGHIRIELMANGYNLNREYELKAGEELTIDFEQECAKEAGR